MNFENKQFKLGRFYERISLCIKNFAIGEQMNFINGVSRELEVQLTDELAFECVKLSFYYQTHYMPSHEDMCVVKYKRKNYYMFGDWYRLNQHMSPNEFFPIILGLIPESEHYLNDEDRVILHIENGKLERTYDSSVVIEILKIYKIEVEKAI
jgi:beta-lactamase class D